MFNCLLHKGHHAFLRDPVVAQVQLLQDSAVAHDARQLHGAFIIDGVPKKLQHPQARTSLAKLHHFGQPHVGHLVVGEVNLLIIQKT